MNLFSFLSGLALLFIHIVTLAQNPVKIFRTKEGKVFSIKQLNMLKRQGYPIGEISSATSGDTTIIYIDIKPKEEPSGNYFVKKYKDKRLPPFHLKTLEGKVIDSEALLGTVVMINFWSTTCGPCIEEYAAPQI